MFSYISLEERVPAAHPLRKLRGVVDALLATMNPEFEAFCACRGRPSVPPEMPQHSPSAAGRARPVGDPDAYADQPERGPNRRGQRLGQQEAAGQHAEHRG